MFFDKDSNDSVEWQSMVSVLLFSFFSFYTFLKVWFEIQAK